MVFLRIYCLSLSLFFLFWHLLSLFGIALDIIIHIRWSIPHVDILSDDESGNECIFLLFLKVLLDHFCHIGMFLLFNSVHHLIFEILLSFLLISSLCLTFLDAIVMVDILIHFYNLTFEPDHQVVQ